MSKCIICEAEINYVSTVTIVTTSLRRAYLTLA